MFLHIKYLLTSLHHLVVHAHINDDEGLSHLRECVNYLSISVQLHCFILLLCIARVWCCFSNCR